jgi:hypothetical protein
MAVELFSRIDASANNHGWFPQTAQRGKNNFEIKLGKDFLKSTCEDQRNRKMKK